APPLPPSASLPNLFRAIRTLPLSHDTAVFPWAFATGYALVGFADATPLLHRQLVLDRIGGRSIAARTYRGGVDYLVRLSEAWADSIVQLDPIRKIERGPIRFGLVIPSASRRTGTCRTTVPPASEIVHEQGFDSIENAKPVWREVFVELVSASLE